MTASTEPTTLPQLAGDILAVNDTMTADQVLAVRERLLFIKGWAKEQERLLNESLLEWMRANGDLHITPETRLYIGRDKRVKCIDPAATLEAVLVATGGDFGAVCDCLAAQPFKHGAARKPLGEAWPEHFNEEWADTVKIKEMDSRFGNKPPQRKELSNEKK